MQFLDEFYHNLTAEGRQMVIGKIDELQNKGVPIARRKQAAKFMLMLWRVNCYNNTVNDPKPRPLGEMELKWEKGSKIQTEVNRIRE